MPNENQKPKLYSLFSNGHLQTIWTSIVGKYTLRKTSKFFFSRTRFKTPDNDFLDFDWLVNKKKTESSTLLVLFHGLEGSSESQYSLAFANIAIENSWSFVVINFRGCSGEINLAPRAYHAGDTEEIDWVLKKIDSIVTVDTIFCVGISLGGNALLKWLSMHDRALYSNISRLKAIAVVSAPLDLVSSGTKLDNGVNGLIYSRFFLRTMKKKAKHKWNQFPGLFDLENVICAKTMKQFDNSFTAPVHKFLNVYDYWKKSSSIDEIKFITSHSLIVNAKNDPIVPSFNIKDLNITSENVEYWNPNFGGHVGFSSKINLKKFESQFLWMPRMIGNWFLKTHKTK